ncbi:CRISPR-associated helicase Cas3' [Paenibacillus apiarius]|uniref:CRISPR-associated helicase Cas3' n=1 Tax=Paenibacillus apiarius TaxID=46240 RepID=UPI003B3B8AE5
MEYLAHFDRKRNQKQRLSTHLHTVSNYCELAVPPTVSFPHLSISEVRAISRLLGLLHDIGKYTDAFQLYLTNGVESKMKNHAHISAFYTHAFTHRMLADGLDQADKHAWSFIAYLCTRLHHGNLTLKGLFKEEMMWTILNKQSSHLMEKSLEVYRDLDLNEWVDFKFFHSCPAVQQLQKVKRLFISMPEFIAGGRLRKEYWYFALVYFFSVLIDSDKLDSGALHRSQIAAIPSDVIPAYLLKKHPSRRKIDINDQRERARRQMLSVIEQLSDQQLRNECIYAITAPTGIGKTLASLQCALRLQERLREVYGYTPRIITAIPFVNIIEQTASDYEQVLNPYGKLLVHHRLTNLFPEGASASTDRCEETSVEQRLLEVESWEADVILTTFVQLFQSLLTGNNRLLKKVNKLAGSIVILDEVQSLPERYMPLLGVILRKMGEYYGTRFILMTATQPKILQLGDQMMNDGYIEPVSLLPNCDEYFKEMKRTKFVPLLEEKINNEQFIELFMTYRNEGQSTVIVVNTIKRSIDLFRSLKKAQEDGRIPEDSELYYLSTNIVPMQRRQVIQTVKERLDLGKPVILVSTQTIEAGVDLDFDIGFRDLAPLTSLVQTAGRVNREGKKGELFSVYIIEFEKDNQYVYDIHHMNRTRNLLENIVEEPMYPELVDRYYTLLMNEASFEESERLWHQGIIGLDFDVLEQFELIQQHGEVVDVFVEWDERATDLADIYERVRQGEWPGDQLCALFQSNSFRDSTDPSSLYEKKAVLQQLTSQMSQYMVQVRVKKFLGNRSFPFQDRNGVVSDWFWVPRNQIEEYYHVETGFMDETGGAFIY